MGLGYYYCSSIVIAIAIAIAIVIAIAIALSAGFDSSSLSSTEVAQLNSGLEYILDIVGETIPEQTVKEALVASSFDAETALSQLLSKPAATQLISKPVASQPTAVKPRQLLVSTE